MNYPTTNARAEIKTKPEDFIVNERLDFDLTGEGEHLWCYVEKIGMNTSYLERQWTKLIGCQRRDISHSGLKDRHAKTRQWLCLPAIYADKLPNQGEGWQIIERQYHQKKLRIGTHKYNEFNLMLKQVEGKRESIDAALGKIKAQGFLNTFAEQRFGHNNLAQAKQWVERNQLPKKREDRAQVLSTLRAFLFNEQVNLRNQLNLINRLLIGDHAMLAGSHSHFIVTDINDALEQRLRSGDITPGGWLVGKEKQLNETTEAARIRAQALAEYPEMVNYLKTHCQEDWREMTVRPSQLQWSWQSDNELRLEFVLPKGSFATSLLGQIFHITDMSQSNE